MANAVRQRPEARARTRAARIALLAGALTLLGPVPARAQLQPAVRAQTAPGELLVQFDSGTSGSQRADARDAAGTTVDHALRQSGLQLLQVESGTSVDAA